MFSPAGSATLIVVSTFSASAALPYEHLELATAGLRAELRRQLLAADVQAMPRWETFTVTGSIEFTDLRGRLWYQYRAAVEAERPEYCNGTWWCVAARLDRGLVAACADAL